MSRKSRRAQVGFNPYDVDCMVDKELPEADDEVSEFFPVIYTEDWLLWLLRITDERLL